ncbi:MAG: hypothetical protein CMK46_06745 [Porticoccus sp.]|jgi:transposase-like protein|nr:hypothetical protein [Rhodospirillaceae bacterium]MAY26215.1 hypothetical protein [Polycyclovorans sp.]MBG57971.1 hypothetical protein [Porticoccus sp.]MAX61578.1 hypothetical protein [Rhodospirillaceae bacterium]MAX61643.1 hypothetical protein [Rhodospirillaceae bacterium]|tara:strand:+ start:10027 stop:10233 length:207 start_codon:yes stop_codon:yes gene_type:complete
MTWKQRIDELMLSGESVDSIARHMGVTANAVREIIKGRTAAPRADAAISLLALHQSLIRSTPSTSEAA